MPKKIEIRKLRNSTTFGTGYLSMSGHGQIVTVSLGVNVSFIVTSYMLSQIIIGLVCMVVGFGIGVWSTLSYVNKTQEGKA